ncbi:hypothetical protein TrRE_jg11772, partial [Triparma retinervis]
MDPTIDDREDEEKPEAEDIESLKAEIAQMEAEAAALSAAAPIAPSIPNISKEGDDNFTVAAKTDDKSVYVGQVEYSCTPEDLVKHFKPCGAVERVTIQCDKYTGNPKGYAYVEFKDAESVEKAVALDGSELKGRSLKVTLKRINE